MTKKEQGSQSDILKSDSSGLLTDLDMMRLGQGISKAEADWAIAKAQRDLTASIFKVKLEGCERVGLERGLEVIEMQAIIDRLNTECQARMERIFRWGNEMCNDHRNPEWPKELGGGKVKLQGTKRRRCSKCWQALKEGIDG